MCFFSKKKAGLYQISVHQKVLILSSPIFSSPSDACYVVARIKTTFVQVISSSRSWVTLPGMTVGAERVTHLVDRVPIWLPTASGFGNQTTHPAMSPIWLIWEQVGAPIYHLLLNLGSLGGLLSVAVWIWAVAQQIRNLLCLSSGIKGNSSGAKGLDVLALLASLDVWARRIQELESLGSKNNFPTRTRTSNLLHKVIRCLARYSPRATTTNQPTNRAPNKPAWPGPKWTIMPISGQIWSFLGKKS